MERLANQPALHLFFLRFFLARFFCEDSYFFGLKSSDAEFMQ